MLRFNLLRQTIALFRYQLLGLINFRSFILLLAILLTGFLVSQFVAELAIINREQIGLAFAGDFFRYTLVLLMIITVCQQIAQDYELSQFDRFLSMPINRAQYIFAQLLMVLTTALALAFSVLLYFLIAAPLELAFYWFISLFLELVLTGLFAMLAITSLEKLPGAIIFSLALYLLSRVLPIIDSALQQTSEAFADTFSQQFSEWFFNVIQYLLPGTSAFAQNNILFEADLSWRNLGDQFLTVSIYGSLLLCMSLIDFYRKEFNR